MENNIASFAEAEIGTETVKTVLLTPARYKDLLSTLESLQRENEELREDNERLAAEVELFAAQSALSSTGDTHGN